MPCLALTPCAWTSRCGKERVKTKPKWKGILKTNDMTQWEEMAPASPGTSILHSDPSGTSFAS